MHAVKSQSKYRRHQAVSLLHPARCFQWKVSRPRHHHRAANAAIATAAASATYGTRLLMIFVITASIDAAKHHAGLL